MKKLLFLFIFSGFILSDFKISAQNFLDQDKMNSAQEMRDSGYYKLALVFRHHYQSGETCSNSSSVCTGCICRWGICICSVDRPVQLEDDQGLTQAQIENGMGIAWVKVVNEEMHMIFETACDSIGIIKIYNPNGGETADNIDYSKFGASQTFSILNDTYAVIKTKYTLGETVVSISYD